MKCCEYGARMEEFTQLGNKTDEAGIPQHFPIEFLLLVSLIGNSNNKVNEQRQYLHN
jgi:hypothetical protein